VMEGLRVLKTDGYLIAVEEFSGNPDFTPLYQLANILGVDVHALGTEELAARMGPAAQHNATLLALRVQNQTQFKLCQESGFSLFHGPFFKSPDQITIRKLSSNEALRFKLLKMMEEEEPDIALFAETVKADATISLRLLAYMNSAAFHFNQTIKTIQQTILLLGWRNVKNWLRVILLADVSQNKAAHELVLLSAQRGLFLELVARDHDFWGFDPASMHMLGTFSLLDALLNVPMADVVANLPLDRKMKGALCREPNNEYLPLLRLAQSLEEARWADSDKMIQQLNLDSKKVRAAFKTSVTWAVELELFSATLAA
jgi:EAL and modified HD-GYP domain-containing signal transduction protein